MEQERHHYHQTAIGLIEIVENGEAVTGLFFHQENPPFLFCEENELTRQAIRELD